MDVVDTHRRSVDDDGTNFTLWNSCHNKPEIHKSEDGIPRQFMNFVPSAAISA